VVRSALSLSVGLDVAILGIRWCDWSATDPLGYAFNKIQFDAAAGGATLIRASSGAAPAGAGNAAAAVARVVHAKAPLRDRPDAGDAAHGYRVQGDAVTLPDRSKAADGWIKVTAASGIGYSLSTGWP
jgi:hypothetical protein